MTPMATFEGRPWRLVGWADAAGRRQRVPPHVEATATFADGVLAGRGGCNRFRGPYTLAGDSLAVGPLAGTLMACDEDAMRVESAFHAGLLRVVTARATEESLELLDDTGTVVLELVAAVVTPLVGTAWSATGINDGRGGVVSLLEGTTVSATFDADGRLTGSGGCNRYTGAFRLDGAAIAIDGVASTMRACLGPDGVMDQEAAFHAALGRARRWSIDGRGLELRDEDGALQVGFVADGPETRGAS
jgi:heat shock protein HslJ